MDKRIDIQYEAALAWKEANHTGTIILPTGLGKTHIGVVSAGEQLKRNLISSCLIVVPSIPLIDQWKMEFTKWGYDLTGVDILCLQTAYKLDTHYDLLIVDEIHTALSPKYRNVFFNVKHNQIMGLTATKPHNEEYFNFMQLVCPVVFSKILQDALDVGAVSDYMTYNLTVKMNRRDRARYKIFDGQLKRAQMELGLIKKFDPELQQLTIFDIAKQYSTYKNPPAHLKELVKYSKQFWSSMTMRKWVCYEAHTKIAKVIDIITKLSNRKWIIFNKSIKFAELLVESMLERGYKAGIYHSKMTKLERKEMLSNFENNEFQHLIAVDALNAGLNIPEINSAICVSGVSTELTNIQQLGRILRTAENKYAIFVNLYCEDTVEEVWVKNKTKTLKNCSWITNERQIYEQAKKKT